MSIVKRSAPLPDMDFETYSEAGYTFDGSKWQSITNSPPHGIGAVGASVYSEHPSTRVLSLAYDLKDGIGARIWLPGGPPPSDLFDHIELGGLVEAWNCPFEWYIWTNVCHARMGWPPLPFRQLRDAAAKARAFSLPGKLKTAAKAIRSNKLKIEDGTRLLNKFSKPRNPTRGDTRLYLDPLFDSEDGLKLYEYNIRDIEAESEVSTVCPDLIPSELELWLVDQDINYRGVHIDREAVEAFVAIVDQTAERLTAELQRITGGAASGIGEIEKILKWLRSRGNPLPKLDAENVSEALKNPMLPPDVRRVLEIRESLGASSVKKLYSIQRRLSADGRLRDLFAFCGADRTGRFAGRGPQPQNLPNSGPKVYRCSETGNYCDHEIGPSVEWDVDAVEWVIEAAKRGDLSEHFQDPIAAVSGCLRGLFTAAPGRDLICSDYSAIEAVVLAALAGEEWRLEVFRSHGMIYETSAAKITGVAFDEFVRHKKETGNHHPLRKTIGKVAELASGYQGSVGAWKAFGADKHFSSDAEILEAVKAWRTASPNIVKFWYGVEDAARSAIQYTGRQFEFRGHTFQVVNDVLYITLRSGRTLKYHEPRLHPDVTPWGKQVLKITYMGGTNKGWLRLDTYGGKLTENIVQATARDILTHAMVNLQKAGYKIVLHIHDEIVAEVPREWGSVEDFERIMADVPGWCREWPIKASGGWRGKRYRKD